MAPKKSPKSGARAWRVLLIVAANAVCLFLLWKLVFAAHGGPDTEARAATGAASASEEPTTAPRPVRQRDTKLEGRIRAAIAEGERKANSISKGRVTPGECTVSVHVRELGTDGEIVSIDADRAMRPASNLKLVTSAAALVLMGPDGRFETVFESTGRVSEGVLTGDLVAHAGGDPLYDRDAQGDVTRLLAPLVDGLRLQGVRRITGALVLDEGTFLQPGPGPAWPGESQHWQEFCALSGGFNVNAGCLTAFVRATQPGRPADVDVRPHGHGLARRVDVQTGPAKSKLDVRVGVQGDAVRVGGSIPSSVPSWEGRFAAPDPVVLFGGAVLDALNRAGIQVDGGVVRERRAVQADSRVLARLVTPLVDVLGPINTYSNNACADQLFLTMGRWQIGQGTREGGRAATARALEMLGLDAQSLVQVDGSGLSRDNRISARQITGLVDAVLRRDPRAAQAFRDSLAVGGETGTLDRRLGALEGRVHAKTGFIGGTSALSGILDARDGRVLVFSILVEYPNVEGLNTNCWKPMQDDICEALAGLHGTG